MVIVVNQLCVTIGFSAAANEVAHCCRWVTVNHPLDCVLQPLRALASAMLDQRSYAGLVDTDARSVAHTPPRGASHSKSFVRRKAMKLSATAFEKFSKWRERPFLGRKPTVGFAAAGRRVRPFELESRKVRYCAMLAKSGRSAFGPRAAVTPGCWAQAIGERGRPCQSP